MMTITADVLPRFHTKQLLNALRRSGVAQSQLNEWFTVMYDEDLEYARRMHPGFSNNKEKYYEHSRVPASALGYPDPDYIYSEITVAQLKAELAKRPHVLNKPEGKAARRAAAKMGRSRGRRDRLWESE